VSHSQKSSFLSIFVCAALRCEEHWKRNRKGREKKKKTVSVTMTTHFKVHLTVSALSLHRPKRSMEKQVIDSHRCPWRIYDVGKFQIFIEESVMWEGTSKFTYKLMHCLKEENWFYVYSFIYIYVYMEKVYSFIFFWVRFLLHNSGWPWTHYPVLTWIMGLQVCTAMVGILSFFCFFLIA
jgi:hypothetical protein